MSTIHKRRLRVGLTMFFAFGLFSALGYAVGPREAEAQCFAYGVFDACGCTCPSGLDYFQCTTYGQCPSVGCIYQSICLCCSEPNPSAAGKVNGK
jgi:hypothetical protein